MLVYFVGAGPGDPDLMTVKGRQLLEQADVVIYTGSLVSTAHLQVCKATCVCHDSAGLTLEAIISLIEKAVQQQQLVVRLHTGDPTIYGAISEQMHALDQRGIACAIIPGVSSFSASCAALKREFTVPNGSQTVILTRIAGRTPVPESEKLEYLASHHCSMAIFLSVQQIDAVVAQLQAGYQRDDVPVAVVSKATWPDQRTLRGTLKDIAEQVKQAGIDHCAQILVGDFLTDNDARSCLYHPDFAHQYRGQP